jgi:RNA polymerase sigma factor (sigma-70 family)
MATGSMCKIVKHLRRAALLNADAGVADGQFVEAFVSRRDETAFEMLVRRHGPMVLGVCRRVIGNIHDAEDAFQATFLVLARKARTIVPRDLVGNWLHGVALRTAVEARGRLARLRSREKQVMNMPQPSVASDVDSSALHRLLDDELNRLPDKYRAAIILCDLEGRARREAARQLKIPEGTLSSRLATARQMLARRLPRHGLTVPAAALAAALTAQVARASVRPALLVSTVKAAIAAAAGPTAGGLLSAEVISLTQGVLKTMLMHKLKVLTVLLLGAVLGGAGLGAMIVRGQDAANAPARTPPAVDAGRAATPALEEPLDGGLLLNSHIQGELRLSKNQIRRLEDAAAKSDDKHGGTRREIKRREQHIADIEKQIRALQKEIEAERGQIQKLQAQRESDRLQAVGAAAPGILSERATRRLRQIQRQYRGVEQVFNDPAIQKMLHLDDEQMMKIEKALKQSPPAVNLAPNASFLHYNNNLFLFSPNATILDTRIPSAVPQNTLVQPMSPWGLARGTTVLPAQTLYMDPQTNNITQFLDPNALSVPRDFSKVGEILTEEQKRILRSWIGEPYSGIAWGNPWSWLWKKDAKKR